MKLEELAKMLRLALALGDRKTVEWIKANFVFGDYYAWKIRG